MIYRLLVTGSSGQIGRAVVQALSNEDVVGFDRMEAKSNRPKSFIRGQLVDAVALSAAMEKVDCVIHLAAAPDDEPTLDQFLAFPSDGDNFLSDLVPSNVIGLYHLLKSAVRSGVRRVILASSGQVISRHLVDGNSRVNAESALTPRYLYACTKVFLESMGRVFAREHGLEVLIARLGWCPRPGQEESLRNYPLAPYVYLSDADVGQFFAAAVRCPEWPKVQDADGKEFTFSIAYVTSCTLPENQVYDLSVAKKLGFSPDPRHGWQAWLKAQGATA